MSDKAGGQIRYLLTDYLGSTSVVADADGHKVAAMRYTAWGEVRYNEGELPTHYTYTGQYSHADTFGLLFYNARYYSPTLGRFVSADTLIPPGVQGLDRYAYVNNNPLKYTDPSGHWVETAWDIISIGWDICEIARDPGNAWNWAALALDVGAAVLPAVPAVAGVVMRGGKAAKAGVELATHADEGTKIARALSHADEAASVAREIENVAEASLTKTSELPSRFSRYMSRTELEAVQETGLLRGGRPGDTYFTTNRYRTVQSAEDKLALPQTPEIRMDFEIINQPQIYGPRRVAPAFGKPGGGIEFWSPDPVKVRIIRVYDLK